MLDRFKSLISPDPEEKALEHLEKAEEHAEKAREMFEDDSKGESVANNTYQWAKASVNSATEYVRSE